MKRGELTEKYYEDKQNSEISLKSLDEEFDNEDSKLQALSSIISILDSVYDPNANKPENARANNVEVTLDKDKLDSKAFQELWSRINHKSYYIVEFDENELVKKAVRELNARLRVSKIYFKVEMGEQTKSIESKEQLETGEAFVRRNMAREDATPYMTMMGCGSWYRGSTKNRNPTL